MSKRIFIVECTLYPSIADRIKTIKKQTPRKPIYGKGIKFFDVLLDLNKKKLGKKKFREKQFLVSKLMRNLRNYLKNEPLLREYIHDTSS